LELIQTLTKLHAAKVKPYSKNIVNISMQSSQSTASDKRGAVQTIFELVTPDALVDEVDKKKQVEDLMKVFKTRRVFHFS
jgi:hypothetical protein